MRYCNNCGREISDTAKVCPYCGTSLDQRQAEPAAAPVAPAAPAGTNAAYAQPNYQQPTYAPQQPAPAYIQPQVNVMAAAPITEANLPAQYKPLGAWAYFGLTLLFAIPIVGFIFLIIFSVKKTNINRRNFARSFWIPIVIAAIVFLILFVIALANGGVDYLEDMF